MPGLRPFESDKSATRITVPSAYRAWAYWATTVGYGCLQVAGIKAANLDTPTELLALCEVYSRAVFETQLGLHFDQCDSKCDVAVLILIRELYTDAIAIGVHRNVAARGPVVRDYDAAVQDALLDAANEAQEALRLSAENERADIRTTPPPPRSHVAYCYCAYPTRDDSDGTCCHCGMRLAPF